IPEVDDQLIDLLISECVEDCLQLAVEFHIIRAVGGGEELVINQVPYSFFTSGKEHRLMNRVLLIAGRTECNHGSRGEGAVFRVVVGNGKLFRRITRKQVPGIGKCDFLAVNFRKMITASQTSLE